MTTPATATGSGLPSHSAPVAPPTHKLDAIPRGRPIPVGLTEAGLDSPSFRASVAYYGEQIEAIERWLENTVRNASKLTHDILGLENSINQYLNQLIPPSGVAEHMMDQDYTLLALKRVSDGSRDWWSQVLSMMRKIDFTMVEPVRAYVTGDLRAFKETRKILDSTQKTFDQTLARYTAQNKTKEASALREEAFAVHETRKAYLKASMDFCVLAPQARASLDKLMVRLCYELAKEVKKSREASINAEKWTDELERIRGWSREMEAAEPSFKRELATIRREIGDAAVASYKPSRELDAYSASTVPFLGSRGPVNMQSGKDGAAVISERQGWLFLKTVSGKPARTNWVRRWFYCRDGVFGSLQQNSQGVFQGDEIGVLLCSAKPAISEERRFCFEVKTKISTLVLQTETQQQLSEWLEVFEAAKKRAFELSTSKEAIPMRTGSDLAFSITPPSISEFSARNIDSGIVTSPTYDDNSLNVPGAEPALASRASFDMHGAASPRRSITAAIGRDMDDSHQSRTIMFHRKNTFNGMDPPHSPGISSLISAIPVGTLSKGLPTGLSGLATAEVLPGTLAPLSMPRPPLGTQMSRAAVYAALDRNLVTGTTNQLPAFMLANYWGSNAWSSFYADGHLDYQKEEERTLALAASEGKHVTEASSGASHCKTMSAGVIQPTLMSDETEKQNEMSEEGFPADYPAELKAQHASFRLLFPSVPASEKLVLVFRAAWSSTRGTGADAGDAKLTATGRVFVTPDNLHFYGQRMGLLVAFSLSLDLVSEITSAPGKECDYLFLHLTGSRNTSVDTGVSEEGKKDKEMAKPANTGLSRITIKTFLEDLRLLHARLNILMDNLQAEEPMKTQDIIGQFLDMERDADVQPPLSPSDGVSVGSWEEVEQIAPSITLALPPAAVACAEKEQNVGGSKAPLSPALSKVGGIIRKPTGFSTSSRTRGYTTSGRLLPLGPTQYVPSDASRKTCEKHFDIGAKACFHVVFGDRSYIFARLYHNRQNINTSQGPWAPADQGRMRREFTFDADAVDMLGRTKKTQVTDFQTIDVFNDHETYVVSHVTTSWHLPFSGCFKVITKTVITHEAKSRCKLAIYTHVDWMRSPPPLSKRMVDKQAMDDAIAGAEDLAGAIVEQVNRLGAHSRTKKAIQVYGHIGHSTQTVLYSGGGVLTAVEPGTTRKQTVQAAVRAGTKGAMIRPRTLTQMVFDTIWSTTESVVTSVLMWVFAVLRSIFKVLTTHRALLGLLVASTVLNLVMTSKEGSTWWSERRAARFMQRVGVGPNVVMSRAVRWENLGEAVDAREPLWHDSECYASFQAVANASDPDAFLADAFLAEDGTLGTLPNLLSTPHSQAASRRIHRTRQRLGSYRHDLLVAMRVVNKVEREMEMAEWENWVADENMRCMQLRHALEMPLGRTQDQHGVPRGEAVCSEEGKECIVSESTKVAGGKMYSVTVAATTAATTAAAAAREESEEEREIRVKAEGRRELMRQWYREYCGSCRADARELEKRGGARVLGRG